ncbi:MAG: hypothetical protein KUF77_01455 [Candidatus Thiodiazotropha sp. (ex Lucina aurantia)]|nr:hypothetical protein [Candidatus Thiodiazotropha taylori]MBV2098268.1 hypothetical protein [Candidatus Thiodiazotropha sp. (ex Codakia orbicularis)]MBV2101675.1 hypothetical protein [Candidatus Thiodiazotropha sp. (ex Lucina aurantia)]MBV2116080.1 hypothetical protein [Candidatus Thiodiazotropha sp. (ex Lucina aurantia)]
MYFRYLNIALKVIGYVWCSIALVITWASDWALITGKTELFGITVFNVKNSFSLALLLFPGAVILLIPYVLEKRFSIGISKKAAIKQYCNRLPSLLFRRYGRSANYSYSQVKNTIIEHNLSKSYIVYAFAMYLSLDDYDENVLGEKHIPAYIDLRKEIGNSYFDGKLDFDALSISTTLHGNTEGVETNTSEGGSDSSGSGDSSSGDG